MQDPAHRRSYTWVNAQCKERKERSGGKERKEVEEKKGRKKLPEGGDLNPSGLPEPYGNLGKILVRLRGEILHGNITIDFSEPYDNLGKILVGSPWTNLGSNTNDLSEPYDNLGKILVRSPWTNLAW